MNKQLQFDKLYSMFPELREALDSVGVLDIESLMKQPYSALIGVIAGQKITFKQAKQIRSFIYTIVGGTNFTPGQITQYRDRLKHLECWPIIERVNAYLSLQPNDFLNKTNSKLQQNIRSLINVKGIGPWTIESTLLTCLGDGIEAERAVVDIFPSGDKFLQNALVRLGLIKKPTKTEVNAVTSKWVGYRGWITWYLWRWFP